MEVIFNELSDIGVSCLGVDNLPGRLVETDFGHFSTKPSAGGGPVDARRKVFLGYAFPPPLILVHSLPLPLCTSR